MAKQQPAPGFRHERTLFGVGAVGVLTDGELLERFANGHRDAAESAFTALVERHGPMVLRVCRCVLGDSDDVQDAFQATFLVLMRKAGSLWVRDSIGPWLHGVALRVANKAKVASARRKAHERRGAEAAAEARGGANRDLAPTLHEEVGRLPQKYRAPVVLCYLEGLTHEGAATALGWPVGTVRGRLSRARDLLRTRLVRRGLAPSAGAFVALLAAEEVSAAPLPESAIRVALALVAEWSAGTVPAAVVTLTDGCLRTMTMTKLKGVSVFLLVGITALGLAGAARLGFSKPGRDANPPPPPVRAEAAGPAQPAPETWPAGVEVRGRVVDHRGAAVAGADVLLLGDEKLTIFANLGAAEGPVRYSVSTQPAGSAPTVKTDRQGRFSLRRPASPANRIAVVAPQMLLWEVARKEVTDANDLVVTLPQPVGLTVRAEIPEKTGKQEFWVVGRLLNRVDWESDSLFYRGILVPNPGERTVAALPPAQYAIERINFTPQDSQSNLMTPCERRLVQIKPGTRADVRYDRKTGRRVEGRVRGLENAKLRYAFVTIGFPGPEELFSPGGKPSRMFTHFDVIPVGPDGRFTTPPLPANRYEFQLTAMHATTPNLSARATTSTARRRSSSPRRASFRRSRFSPRERRRAPPIVPRPTTRKSRDSKCAPATRPASRSRTLKSGSTARRAPRRRRSESTASRH